MKRIVSIVLALAISVSLCACMCVYAKDYSNYAQRFWDLPKGHWAFADISELVDRNVISGYEDGSFKPERTVTRAEWAKMMCVASGKQPINTPAKAKVTDVNSSDWYYGYVNAVSDYMDYYASGNAYVFKPNQAATREDVIVSLVKMLGYPVDEADYSYIGTLTDTNTISNHVKKYIAVAIEKGIVKGYEDNTFRGQNTLTRAEAATLLNRAFKLGNNNKVDSDKVA